MAENFLIVLKSIHPPQSNTVFVLLFDNNLYFNIKLPSTDSYLMHSLSINVQYCTKVLAHPSFYFFASKDTRDLLK